MAHQSTQKQVLMDLHSSQEMMRDALGERNCDTADDIPGSATHDVAAFVAGVIMSAKDVVYTGLPSSDSPPRDEGVPGDKKPFFTPEKPASDIMKRPMKELKFWTDETTETDCFVDLYEDEGWDAELMFKTNNVDPNSNSFPECHYTIPVPKFSDHRQQEMERLAEEHARSIESSHQHQKLSRLERELEMGVDVQ